MKQIFYILLIEILIRSGVTANSIKLSNDTNRRSRREFETKYLAFPEGSNVQLVYCLTISTYTKPVGMFTVGITSGLAWELPHRNTVSSVNSAKVYHRRSRRELYRKVELMLKMQGKDGQACVLKAICKAAKRSQSIVTKGTFLEEILHSVFTFTEALHDGDQITEYEKAYLWGENCNGVQDRCPDLF